VALALLAALLVAKVFTRSSELAAAGQTPDPSTPPVPSEPAPEATDGVAPHR